MAKRGMIVEELEVEVVEASEIDVERLEAVEADDEYIRRVFGWLFEREEPKATIH